jgi:dipeptidyl aminopeptidase/acylaminoacyl peptidase
MRVRTTVCLVMVLPLAASRPLQVDDLFKVKQVTDPQVSAKGDAAWQVGSVDVPGNRITTRIWFKPAAGEARELALGEGSQSRPRFSPDGARLAYQAGGQVWICDLSSGENRQLTRLSGGASGQIWSSDGAWIAFVSTTVPSGLDAENESYLKAKKERRSTGKHIKGLMYRHLKAWKDPAQLEHLFIVPSDGSAAPRDLTAGVPYDVPNFAGVAAGDDYAFSPDSKFIAFGAHPEQHRADSTNGELFEVAVEGGPIRQLTRNPAMDSTPRYSPDGKYLAWRAQRRPGFEADRWELWVADRVTRKVLWTTHRFDKHVRNYAWQGKALVLAVQEEARQNLYRWEPGTGDPKTLTRNLMVEAFALHPDGGALVQKSDLATPPDLFRLDLARGAVERATRFNEPLAKELGLNPGESITVKGGAGKDGQAPDVQAWVVKPVGYDPARTYPVAFVIHGGPQGAWNDQWHPRWNAQAWAGRGYLTVLPNPRGSSGWGQAFCDQISGDWNGLVMKDLLNVLDGVLKAYPKADAKRVVCAGGSYGGYAVNWLAGHAPERFAAFVTHAGIFNTESMQLGTEELWFPKWEFQGWPWESPANAARWRAQSPLSGAGKLRTPHLVTHGEIDYRVPVGEAYQLFNVLQLRKVPSELLVFPDEGHFVAKPANSKQWYEAVLGWCDRWAK